MKKVTRLPTSGIKPHSLVTVKEMYAQPEPTDLMVWAVCPYLRDGEKCRGCPDEETRDEDGEVYTRGCRLLAAEACRMVTAAKDKGEKR